MLNIVLAANEPRANYLFNMLHNNCNVLGKHNFDQIDLMTKSLAALLSFKLPMKEWWGNYQMHPLVQRRRRNVLRGAMAPYRGRVDALLMWGSWFHPNKGVNERQVPCFHYIDQSRSLRPVLGEPQTSERGRRASYILQAETYANSCGIFCMSQWARDQTLASHDIPLDKIHVVGWGPCGVDLSEETITSRKPIVLHVSNDFYRKGLDYLIETAEIVKKLAPQATFLVIGKDEKFKPSKIPNNVKFLGPIYDQKILENFFREASAFFLPYRFDRNPHVLIEAMSAALPLVVSEQGGGIELIRGKNTGYLVPIGDIKGYAEAIATLITNRSLRDSMGEACLSLMREQYNWNTIARKIVTLMEEKITL